MISAMTYLGLITALLLILRGFICFRWPRLLSFYSTMSPAELKNVDLKAAGRISLITMSVTGVVSDSVLMVETFADKSCRRHARDRRLLRNDAQSFRHTKG